MVAINRIKLYLGQTLWNVCNSFKARPQQNDLRCMRAEMSSVKVTGEGYVHHRFRPNSAINCFIMAFNTYFRLFNYMRRRDKISGPVTCRTRSCLFLFMNWLVGGFCLNCTVRSHQCFCFRVVMRCEAARRWLAFVYVHSLQLWESCIVSFLFLQSPLANTNRAFNNLESLLLLR